MTSPVLFDMDGVILEGPRTAPGIYADAADDALAELGAEPALAQRRDLRRHDLEHVVEHCEALEIDAAAFWRLTDKYASERTHERIRSGERGLYDDVHALEELAAKTTVGLVTNNRHATGEFVADSLPVDFAVVRGRQPTFEDYRRRKPDPTFLEDACDNLPSTMHSTSATRSKTSRPGTRPASRQPTFVGPTIATSSDPPTRRRCSSR